MSNISQEEIIDLQEFKSPTNTDKKVRRNNRVGSPKVNSPESTKNDRGDIVSLFSVKSPASANPRKRSVISSVDGVSVASTDISDEVFIKSDEKSVTNKTYRDKLRERFNVIRNRTGSSVYKAGSHRGSREKLLLDKIRKESKNLDAEVENKRNKYKLKEFNSVQVDFFSGNKVTDEVNVEESEEPQDDQCLVVYKKPEQHQAELEIYQTENCFRPSSAPLETFQKLDEEPRYLDEEGLYVDRRKLISQKCENIIEQRLLSIDDKKWFNCEGKLIIQPNPVLNISLREKRLIDDPTIATLVIPSANIECSEVVIARTTLLQVYIGKIQFDHHPLFSIEHVLERKLIQLHQDYENYTENNKLPRILKKLEALRHVKKNFEKTQQEDKSAEKRTKYKQEIEELRELAYEQGKVQRDNIKAILDTWKCIKKIREVNGYNNTRIKLMIKKVVGDVDHEITTLEKQINDTLQEYIENYKIEFEEKMRNYKRQMRQWKLVKDNQILEEGDNTTDEPPSKPQFHIDKEKIRSEIKKRHEESFKPPGEPNLQFFLLEEKDSRSESDNSKEKIRRNAVKSTKILLRILCNKIEVCKTAPVLLNDEFSCEINENVSIQLSTIPRYLTVEVIEQPKSLMKRRVCEIDLALPDNLKNSSLVKDSKIAFEKNEIIHYKHEGVGSGIKLSKILEDYSLRLSYDMDLKTFGYLNYRLSWKSEMNQVEEESSTITNPELLHDILDKNGTIDVDKLDTWLASNNPDPQDPKNSILYEYILGFKGDLTFRKKTKPFRLSPHLESFQFCDIKEIEENLRLTILQLRNQNEIEFDGMVIPNRTKEISINMLSDYKRRVSIDNRVNFGDDFDQDLETQRSNSKKYLRQIQNKVFQKCKNYDNNLLYENVVNEKYLPYLQEMIKVLLVNFFNWFRWKPRMSKPLPSINKDEVTQTPELVSQVHVVFNINSIINLKYNAEKTKTESNKSVNYFVELVYKDLIIRSLKTVGHNTTWNEVLSFPLESQNIDYLNPNALNGTVVLNLYNKNVEDENKTEWLGFIEIPIAAICCNNTLSGKYKVEQPYNICQLITELEKQKAKSPRSNPVPSASDIYIDMNLSIVPPIPKLTPSMNDLPSNDAPFIQEHILQWNEAYNNNYPNRKFFALAIDVHGKTNCLTKFLKPLEPPQEENESHEFGIEQCSRFVSLIPFANCNQFYNNVWLTTEQLLNLALGSIIDHAVTLTCFLMALKVDAYLLLGFGLPHGSTAYVLVKHFQKENDISQYYVIDVTTGKKYFLTDEYCPLQRLFCLVDEENIWANIQRTDNIQLTRFDLNRRSDWLPLFNNNISAPVNAINLRVEYKPILNPENLEKYLERKIKKRVSKLRKLNRTIWRHGVTHIFRNFLKSMETNAMFERSHYDVVSEMFQTISNEKLNGYILNMPFMNVSSILKKIEDCGIHNQPEENIEFGLGLYLQSYPGQVLSVWICIVNFNNE